KQKLGLACTLIGEPAVLLLDEPTVGVDPLSRRELWKIILHLVHDQALTVLLSTSYLDEAERCDNVVVLYSGKTLAQGRPVEISNYARTRSFVAIPPSAHSARELQAGLLTDPAIIDAVPEAGRVRFVCSDTGSSLHILQAGTKVVAVERRFEDGFMVLL